MRQGLQGLRVRRGQQGLRESKEFKAMWGQRVHKAHRATWELPGNEGLLE